MNRDVGRPGFASRIAVAVLCVATAAALGRPARADGTSPPAALATVAPVELDTIPAGTKIAFSLLKPVSSQTSVSGSRFAFVMLAPIAIDGRTVVPENAVGLGTLVLAGHAGSQGHEGDLTLAIDSIRTPSDALVTFGAERYRINGRNRKIASALLGFVPYVGFGSRYIRGSEIVLAAGEPVNAVLQQPATVSHVAPDDPTPVPNPTPTAS